VVDLHTRGLLLLRVKFEGQGQRSLGLKVRVEMDKGAIFSRGHCSPVTEQFQLVKSFGFLHPRPI